MSNEKETQMGQLAIARGMVNLRTLLTCMERAGREGLRLTDVLLSEHHLTPAQHRELVERLSDVEAARAELELGGTMVLEGVSTALPIRMDTFPETMELELDADLDLELDGEDRYDFLGELGRGGMGVVTLAKDRVLNREVAVKQLLPEHQTETFRNRLLLEAQVTGLLEHPNIAPVYDLRHMSNGEPFYTMRVVRERSLEDMLAAMRSGEEDVSLTVLINVLRQVSLAVHYAHDLGVIHRDLKPENILVGQYGEVYVIDWGIAKVTQEKLGIRTDQYLSIGALVGTPRYMAPEQARGDNANVDARTDVYALGTILYEMLTLERMFHADHVLALLVMVVSQEPLAPSAVNSGRVIPAELEEICLRAIAKEPDSRFQSAQEFSDELDLFLEGVKERDRRRFMAVEAVEQAEQAKAVYDEVRAQYQEVLASVEQESYNVETWEPLAKKQDLYRIEQQAEEVAVEIERRFGETVRMFAQALVHVPNMPEARSAIASLYWGRFQEAEASGNLANAAYFEGLLRQYNDGQFDSLLEGSARLSLTTDPPGVMVNLKRYEREGRRLVEWEVAEIGPTPVENVSIPHGSYVADLTGADGEVIRLPIVIGRSQDADLEVRIPRSEEVPEGFVYIPAGEFDAGETREYLAEFSIMRYPVTVGEYLEFLNSVSPETAKKHAPRVEVDSYLPVDENGKYQLPGVDLEGDTWDAKWPILMVNAGDAEAYAGWLGKRLGREFRLPSALEWEKAARGVDGRDYPWGNGFDPAFCNMRESIKGRPAPLPVGTNAVDCSPFGVRDMAGNIAEWTCTPESPEDPERLMLKGASYNSMGVFSRVDSHMASPREFRYGHYGFRLVSALGEA